MRGCVREWVGGFQQQRAKSLGTRKGKPGGDREAWQAPLTDATRTGNQATSRTKEIAHPAHRGVGRAPVSERDRRYAPPPKDDGDRPKRTGEGRGMTDREGQPSRRREESGQPRDPEWQEWTEEREEERAAAYEKQRERQAGGWTEWTWEEEYRRREARSRRHQTHPGGESGEEPRHPGPRRERSGTWDQRDRAPEPQNSRTREQRGAEGQYSWTEVRSRWTCGSRSERRSPNPGREQPTALGRPPATTPWKAGRDKASKPESRGWGRNPPRGERADPVYERGGLGAHQEYSQRASGGSQGLPYTRRGSGTRGLHSQTGGRGAKGRSGCRAFSEKNPHLPSANSVCVLVANTKYLVPDTAPTC